MPLISQLQQMYRAYKFEIIPVLVRALGSIPNRLNGNLERIGTEKSRVPQVAEIIQRAALIGSVKVCKTALKMCNDDTKGLMNFSL